MAANVSAVSGLARISTECGITLVHVSSDYVFDGAKDGEYSVRDSASPVSVYGQSKAAGDAIVSVVPRHYIVRTSWVIGDGANFVRTMASLAERGVDPRVVDDQVGRLAFASEIARGIHHLLRSASPFGVYNLTGAGEPMSWYQIAQRVYSQLGHSPERVQGVSTQEYFSAATGPVAPRPRNSALDLRPLTEAGFSPRPFVEDLAVFVSALD